MSHKNKIITAIFLPILVLLSFASCTNNLKKLTKSEGEIKSRQNLNGYLALEYLEYSRSLADQHNQKDANYFANKGIKAAKNQEIFPEVPEDWKVDNSQIGEANLAREKLTRLFYDQQARQNIPIQLAHLHLLYDCWVSSTKKQSTDMNQCKILFFKLEDEINKYLVEQKLLSEAKIVEIQPPEFTRFDIYFDLGLHKFNSEADRSFVKLLNHLESLNGDYKILVVGNADRMGKKLSNDVLARDRALMVKTRLIKNGVPENLIELKSFSSDNPQIITSQGDKNRSNRSVEVYILKGKDNLSEIPLPLIEQYIYKKEILETKKKRGLN